MFGASTCREAGEVRGETTYLAHRQGLYGRYRPDLSISMQRNNFSLLVVASTSTHDVRMYVKGYIHHRPIYIIAVEK